MWIFLAFLMVPLIEIGLFVQVGGVIGLWPTLAIVIVTAVAGTSLVKSQGAQAMNDLRRSMAELRDPSQPLAHGALILFAGALLLTPGFFTDTCGLLLLVPRIRMWAMTQIAKRVKVQSFGMGPQPGGRQTGPRDTVIDGEFQEVDVDAPRFDSKPPGDSGWTRH
ncbi:exlusion protein FxsA [Thioclava sp. SK-1]|uniref:FxsA family protein n=1 Tax=Thioclava sp. SK-1 TaxID=1889770 RepID=UPI000825063C|nr:FxsA family protein [Thioclava sp. SK-1]OCX61657.1 exlusion protein FxsA [Thioclava sp. SK-1]